MIIFMIMIIIMIIIIIIIIIIIHEFRSQIQKCQLLCNDFKDIQRLVLTSSHFAKRSCMIVCC